MRKKFIGVAFALFLLSAGLVIADEAKTLDVTGVWKWNQARPDGHVVNVVLTLKQDGEKVTGTYHGEGPDSEIYDGKVAGDQLEFRVDREVEGHHVKLDYVGQVTGDAVKGHMTAKAGFHEKKTEWEAKRGQPSQ